MVAVGVVKNKHGIRTLRHIAKYCLSGFIFYEYSDALKWLTCFISKGSRIIEQAGTAHTFVILKVTNIGHYPALTPGKC